MEGAFVQFADLEVDVVIEGFFDVDLAEVVVVFHGRHSPAAGAVDAGEELEPKTHMLRRQCFAMVPLAYNIRCVLNWVSLGERYQLSPQVARKVRRPSDQRLRWEIATAAEPMWGRR